MLLSPCPWVWRELWPFLGTLTSKEGIAGHRGVWFLKAAALKLRCRCLPFACRRELGIVFSVPGLPAQLELFSFASTSCSALVGFRRHLTKRPGWREVRYLLLGTARWGEMTPRGSRKEAALVWWRPWSPAKHEGWSRHSPLSSRPFQWSSFSFWNFPRSVGEAPGFQKP